MRKNILSSITSGAGCYPARRSATAALVLLLAAAASAQLQPPTQPMNSKIGVFRDGFQWILNAQGNGQMQDGVDHVSSFGGVPGDRPVTGNFSGSPCRYPSLGCTNIGIYRSSTQTFMLDANGDMMMGPGDQTIQLSIAQSTDLPVAGDWNGDGRGKVGLFRPSTCEWFLDYDGDGVWNPAIDKHYLFPLNYLGRCTYMSYLPPTPIIGDWNGSGTSKIGLYYPTLYNNTYPWHPNTSGDGTTDGYAVGPPLDYSSIGVAGDWLGTGTWTLGAFTQGSLWLLDSQGDTGFTSQDIEVSYGSGTGSDVPVVGTWTQYVPPANANPDTFTVTVNGTNLGSNGSATPGTPAQLSFTFHDPVNGADDIYQGYIYLGAANGAEVCALGWSQPIPGVPSVYLFDTYTQSDSYCTIANASVTENPSNLGALTLTLNITFTGAAAGQYTVNSMVYDSQGQSTGWGQVGTFVVGNPLTITTTVLPVGQSGQAYSATLAAQGGQPPYRWSLASGTLPGGLALSSNGVVAGTPASAGAYNFPDPVTGDLTNPSFTPLVSDSGGNTKTASPAALFSTGSQPGSADPPCPSLPLMYADRVGLVRGIPGNQGFPPTFNFDSNGNKNGPVDTDPADRQDFFLPPDGGKAGDIAVVGDWAGTGQSAAGWYRPSTAEWWLDRNNDGTYAADVDAQYTYGFPAAGDVPVVGDWTGTGTTKIGVVHQGFLWILDLNGDGVFQQPICSSGSLPNTPGCKATDTIAGDAAFAFQGSTTSVPDIPVVGNWSGMVSSAGFPISQAGMVRTATDSSGAAVGGPFLWLLDAAVAGTSTNVTPQSVHSSYLNLLNGGGTGYGGLTDDIPIPGNWYGTGSEFGFFRNGVVNGKRPGLWVLDGAGPTASQVNVCDGAVFGYGGLQGDTPIVGNWVPIVKTTSGSGSFTLRRFPSETVRFHDPNVPNSPAQCQETPPIAACGGSGKALAVTPSSFTFDSTHTSQTFTVTAPDDATPSATSNPPATYEIPYTVTPGGGSPLSYNLPVYVNASPADNISISVSVGGIDVYGYRNRANKTLHTPNYSLPASWGSTWGGLFGCTDPARQRACMVNALSSWRQQSATSITLWVPLCDSEFGTGIIMNCDGSSSGPQIDPSWTSNFEALLHDLAANGITNLGLRPVFYNSSSIGRLYSSSAVPSGCDAHELSPYWLHYVPSLPFPLATGDLATGFGGYSAKNDGYNCFLSNPGPGQDGHSSVYQHGCAGDPASGSCHCDPTSINPASACGNFVGWPLIFQAFNLVFQQMNKTNAPDPDDRLQTRTKKIQLEAVDLFGEQDIALGQTIVMRMVFDPTHTADVPFGSTDPLDSAVRSACQQAVANLGYGTDVLGWLRCIASHNGMDPGVITMSANERNAYADSVTGAGTGHLLSTIPDASTFTEPIAAVGAFECKNHYGDSSRADSQTMFIHALLGDSWGDSGDGVSGDVNHLGIAGRNFASGLYCLLSPGASPANAPGPLVDGFPVHYAPPRIFDWHSYPRLFDVVTNTPTDPHAVESTYREAAAQYSAFYNLIINTGNLITQPARLQISETHSPVPVMVSIPGLGTQYFTCESWGTQFPTPAVDARLAFVGLRESLPTTTPGFAGTNIRPLYVYGANQFADPPNSMTNGMCEAPAPLDFKDNGYDKTQP